jgi:hypothetical protein
VNCEAGERVPVPAVLRGYADAAAASGMRRRRAPILIERALIDPRDSGRQLVKGRRFGILRERVADGDVVAEYHKVLVGRARAI